jgi:hypothetical protein
VRHVSKDPFGEREVMAENITIAAVELAPPTSANKKKEPS